jgi:hypothetical protein
MIPLYKQPIAVIEEIIYKSKKKAVCNISKQDIVIGDAVYAIKPKNYDDHPWIYLLKNSADTNEDFKLNLNHRKNRTYLLNDFIGLDVPYYMELELRPLITDYEKGKEFLNNVLQYAVKHPFYYDNNETEKPPTEDERYAAINIPPPPGMQLDSTLETVKREVFDGMRHEYVSNNYNYLESSGNQYYKEHIYKKEREYKKAEHLTVKHTLWILAAWLITDVHKQVIKDWVSFTDEAKILLSLSDIPFFAAQVENEMRIPDWQNVLSILFKEKITDTDILWIIDWSKTHAQYIPLIARAVYTYDLFSFHSKPIREFTAYCTIDNATRFIYLFIHEPLYFSMLDVFIHENKYPRALGGLSYYMEGHFYRAALFHFTLNNNSSKVNELCTQMPLKVKYYYNGSPKTFINDTIKWVRKINTK